MPRVRPKEAKEVIMTGALIVTGICEFLEGIEEGEKPLASAKKAFQRTKLRGKAIKKAIGRVGARIRRAGEET